MTFVPAEIIKKKRNGGAVSDDEIEFVIKGYTEGRLPDYQMAAFLMAVYFEGMTRQETLTLTKCMLHSGFVADFTGDKGFRVDKHSTGGVGDKTSLILGPVVAACGVKVPMISGRGLGHTGGTLDKLESIPGFNVNLGFERFQRQVRENDICFIGQTREICPADRKIYALRDVTATVESLPLICASILSKKLAEGIDGLVLDVKFGNGAFMKTIEDAEKLALLLMEVAKLYGKRVATLLTDMNQPLGRYAGNSLEVQECVDILKGKRDPLAEDTRELSLQLSAWMLKLADPALTIEAARAKADEALVSGRAYEKFEELCRLQGGLLANLPAAKGRSELKADKDGFIAALDTEGIGYSCILLHAGRLHAEDAIDPTAGIEFHKKIGDPVKAGETIFTVHGDDERARGDAIKRLKGCVTSSLQKPVAPVLIGKTLI